MEKLISILEKLLVWSKRVVLFLPRLIGLVKEGEKISKGEADENTEAK